MTETQAPTGTPAENAPGMECRVETASFYQIEGWAWCPGEPGAEVQVSLLSADGTVLAGQPALLRRAGSPGGEGHGFAFYGLLAGVSKIAFTAGESRVEEPVDTAQPELPAHLSAYGFYLIHPEDYLFLFIVGRAPIDECVRSYIDGGKAIADEVKALCREFLPDQAPPVRLLDFASGYGRIARGLDTTYFDVTASDIHPQGLAFLRAQDSRIKTLQSTTNPRDFHPAETYDVVFAFSFFSHMPDATYGDWLVALHRLLRPGGLLIFTAHGRAANNDAGIPLKDGYGFRPESEQADLDSADYGTTISELPYVARVMQDRIGQYPILFRESAEMAGGNQDLYIVRKYTDAEQKLASMRRALAEQEQAYVNSTSWRVTKPLRALKQLFSREGK